MEELDLPKLHQEFMTDIHALMQSTAQECQKEFHRAKAAGRSDHNAERIAYKRSKNYWNIGMDSVDKKYADVKPRLQEYARAELEKLQSEK